MCTFLSALPKKSKSNGIKKPNLLLTMKPCKDDENGKKTRYRFRLLAWTSPEKNDRDDAFIERFVHQVWKKDPEKGYSYIDDEVTCPVTKHVKFEGNRYDGCPICKLANQYFMTWRESGWKNKEAAKQNKTIGRKYQAIIPVYVVDDPNYPKNNGQVKAIMFSSKAPSKKELETGNYNKFSFYDEFRKLVEKASLKNCCFNGKNAVDCCIHVAEVQKKVNEGKANEYVFHERIIDKIVFTDSPYDITAITKELVIGSGFDEEYYTSSSLEELQAFYNRNYKISNDDIPEDDPVDVMDSEPAKAPEAPVVENTAKTTPPPVNLDEAVDAMPFDEPASPAPVAASAAPAKAEAVLDDVNSDALLKELGL